MAFSLNPFQRQKNSTTSQQVTPQATLQTNQNYQIFKDVNNDIQRIVSQRSVVSQQVQEQEPLANPIWQTLGVDSDMLMMPVATNKVDRILQYRRIAKFPECDWCLDEIADEFIHEDEHGNFINLTLPDGKQNLNETRKKILQDEFRRYIDLFKLRDEGYNLIKRFLVEGELAWENVIKQSVPSMGIIGVKFLMPEYYETLIDTKTGNPVGLLFDVSRYAVDVRQMMTNAYIGSASVFNAVIPTTAAYTIDTKKSVPLLWSQVTYINSGETTLDGNQWITFPLVEKSKQAYYQLALLYDAAVILRVTRAPERLLYNVSTGRMNDNYAQAYVRDFANSLKSKKVPTTKPGTMGQQDISQVYNPITMLENYVFAKNADSEGTSIESVGSQANYEELGDIEFFLRRFMKQFKVPFSRYKTPENAPPAQDQLSYEEHSFLRMVVRLQRRFALGFKNGFITDLKLKGIWDKYELKESDIDVQFVLPSTYELYEKQQIIETKMNIYKNALGDNEEFSKTTAMKKLLGFSDAEIKENFENLIKEKMINAYADFMSEKVAEHKGLAGFDINIKFKDEADKEVNKDAGGEDKSEDEGSEEEGSEDTSSEESSEESGEETTTEEPAEAPEAKEAPAPTFGLA